MNRGSEFILYALINMYIHIYIHAYVFSSIEVYHVHRTLRVSNFKHISAFVKLKWSLALALCSRKLEVLSMHWALEKSIRYVISEYLSRDLVLPLIGDVGVDTTLICCYSCCNFNFFCPPTPVLCCQILLNCCCGHACFVTINLEKHQFHFLVGLFYFPFA